MNEITAVVRTNRPRRSAPDVDDSNDPLRVVVVQGGRGLSPSIEGVAMSMVGGAGSASR
jgi:hypothetical protein